MKKNLDSIALFMSILSIISTSWCTSLSLQHNTSESEWRLCLPQTLTTINISNVLVDPNPIQTSTPTTFQLKTSQNIVVTHGQVFVNVKYLGIRVYSRKQDLCEMVECPLESGDRLISFVEMMPSVLPPRGKLILTIAAQQDHADGGGRKLFCVQIDLLRQQKQPHTTTDFSLRLPPFFRFSTSR